MITALLLTFATPADTYSMDLASLDQVIQRCERDKALPIFLAEPERRSGFLTFVYTEQAAISGARNQLAERRRAFQHVRVQAPQEKEAQANPFRRDQQLEIEQAVLDDRQRALDELRRVEAIRREAVDEKRQYFLTRCSSAKK